MRLVLDYREVIKFFAGESIPTAISEFCVLGKNL